MIAVGLFHLPDAVPRTIATRRTVKKVFMASVPGKKNNQ